MGRFKVKRKLTPPHERFWDKVEKNDGCWMWLGGKDEHGYGVITIGRHKKARHVKAHRVSYEINVGPIPDGHSVCHHCDNPSCVNPEHLFAATQLANIYDMIAKCRHAFGSRNGQSKLCELDVEIIRSLDGCKGNDIAKFFGVSKSLVSQIRSGQVWRHVN